MENMIGKVLSVSFLAVVVISVASPNRWPSPIIRQYVLFSTPVGSTYVATVDVIRSKGWVYTVDQKRGFNNYLKEPKEIVGSKSVHSNWGSYRGLPLKTHVSIYWGFDDQERLIDVLVRKTRDGL